MRPLFLDWGIVGLGLLLWLLSAPFARCAVPEPLARWTFDGDARDSVGSMHGELLGDATLYDRALTPVEVAEMAGLGPVDENEDVVLEFAVTHLAVEESNAATILVRRTGRLNMPVSATLELRAGSAEVTGEGADLFFGGGQNPVVLTFHPGQTELAVPIQAQLDRRDETSETASLHLLPNDTAKVIGDPLTITIIPWINRIRVGNWSVTEVAPSAISLELETGLGGRVRVQTTSTGTATPGVDFVPVDQEVDFTGLSGGPGQRWVSVPITILRDARIEGDETIGIRVIVLTDYTEVTGAEALLTLVDEPVQVYAVADSSEVLESAGVVRFSLSRVGALESTDVFHVRYRVEGRGDPWETDEQTTAPARAGIDFVTQEGLVEFGPGVTRQPVEIRLLNDSELDGPRGLVLKLVGSPEFPDIQSLGQAEAAVVVGDDEHELLGQEIAWEAFFPDTWADQLRMVERPDGKVLILSSGRAQQLAASGVPDLEFGQRSGCILGKPEDWNGQLPTPRQTPDGRMVFIREGESKIRRLLADGGPDLSFGLAEGTLTLTNKIIQVVHLFPDGSLALLTEFAPEALELVRLRPDGRPDESFESQRLGWPTWGEYPRATHGPDGSYWIIDVNQSLQRLRTDGTVDLAFGVYHDVAGCFGFDASGPATRPIPPHLQAEPIR